MMDQRACEASFHMPKLFLTITLSGKTAVPCDIRKRKSKFWNKILVIAWSWDDGWPDGKVYRDS